ncbi:hypothetical protein PRIPAC_71415 [Pristionchus pacificus]|uniref:Uncharacterized protein n=1 Tax=Pristionchus pacificus TaxID=54126 RepID=A0A2A6D0D5_PRIPA|nr:hypothetical protein PRIPAC_71415 [Pristionchus pacificus]|eukprot:PDM83838.1 hypothetical protein PRIPAC_30325 [Pristionchus pacificus]
MRIVLMFFFFVGITLAQNDEAKEEDLLHSGIGVRIHQKDLDYFAPLLYDAIHHLLLWASLPRIEVLGRLTLDDVRIYEFNRPSTHLRVRIYEFMDYL